MRVVSRVDLGRSTDSGHVTNLCQVMEGSRALETMYNHSSVMYNPARVSGMFRITGVKLQFAKFVTRNKQHHA